MTTIPNLNIVVQQGDLVRETQNIRNQALDSSQLSALERMEEEDRKRSSVAETEEIEKMILNKDSSREKKNKGEQEKKSERRESSESGKKGALEKTGRLLDTVV